MNEIERWKIEGLVRDLVRKSIHLDDLNYQLRSQLDKLQDILQDQRENDIKNFLPKEVRNVHERVL
jgi:hypothetical protein